MIIESGRIGLMPTYVSGNFASDCAAMFIRAGVDFALYDKAPCVEAAGPLAAAVQKMEADPKTFEALAPNTHWGQHREYTEALAFLRYLANATEQSPDAVLRVELIARP